MSLLRRISATFSASVDRAISRVENHDAIIEAALRDARLAAARSRVRLARLRKDGTALEARRSELRENETLWTARAKQLAATDEGRALECLRRRRACAAQLEELGRTIESHRELEQRMSAEVGKIDERIAEMTRQRDSLRSRQSVADAMLAMRHVEQFGHSDIDDAFDRWEINLGEAEYLHGTGPADETGDPLDTVLRNEEETAALRAELAALLAGNGEDRQ